MRYLVITMESKIIDKENSVINKCVCGITTNQSPYDSSVFSNNLTTFYTQITYSDLEYLLSILNSDIPINEIDFTDPKMYLLHVYFREPSIKVIFRFLCSSDCQNGTTFIDPKTTETVFNFIKTVCFKRSVIMEFSDHSMGSLFTNWNSEFMGIEPPIKILPITTIGIFKISGRKEDFMSSAHPTLEQIGDISADELINITFNNMGGTKVFKVRKTQTVVKVISSGNELSMTSSDIKFPVHCEFDYGIGKIIISATHWCNLDKVENNVDIPTLRRYCTEAFGRETSDTLNYNLSRINDPNEMKRAISTAVREISSGNNEKKCKCEEQFC